MTEYGLLLRGLPGTGKTTTASLLRDSLAPSVRVSNDSVRYMAQPRDFSAFSIAASERACFALALSYAKSGFIPVIDGVFDDVEMLADEQLRFAEAGYPLVIITFDAALEDLVDRNNARYELQRMDEERIVELFESYRAVGLKLGIKDKMPEEVRDDVLQLIEALVDRRE